MAELGEIGVRAVASSMERQQIAAAFFLALLFHLSFAFWLQMRSHDVRPLPVLSVIDVKLLPSVPKDPVADLAPPIAVQETTPPIVLQTPPKNVEPIASEPTAVPLPPVSAVITPPSILNNEAGSPAGQFPSAAPGKDYIPSEWALEPPLSDQNLKGLGLLGDVDCLRALSEDCAALRKEVFAEFELTEMEKVWTAQRADTGMPAAFYGMSEREIRLKIGSHIAGENGFMFLPGIAIDGPLWDALHGVKKGCGIKRGINSEGRYDIIKVCPESLPAARDKKYYIPPKE